MHPDLHRYLDGELPFDALAPDLRAQAAEWDALLGAVELESGERAPAWLEARIMTGLPPQASGHVLARAWAWLIRPQPVRVRPAVLAAAAVAAVLLVWRWPAPTPANPPVAAAPAVEQGAAEAAVYVQFVFAHGDARSVAVAGDFNGWEPSRHMLRDTNGDGLWTGTFAVPAGLHKYMFVVDGEQWVTDPAAERYVDDGFGMRNALISIVPPVRRES